MPTPAIAVIIAVILLLIAFAIFFATLKKQVADWNLGIRPSYFTYISLPLFNFELFLIVAVIVLNLATAIAGALMLDRVSASEFYSWFALKDIILNYLTMPVGFLIAFLIASISWKKKNKISPAVVQPALDGKLQRVIIAKGRFSFGIAILMAIFINPYLSSYLIATFALHEAGIISFK